MTASIEIPCRPRQALVAASREHPTLWKRVDQFRFKRGKNSALWPEYCFFPLSHYGELFVDTGWSDMSGQQFSEFSNQLRRLYALAAWRVTQGVYRFDHTIYTTLQNAPMVGYIPYEVLFRLPEWCVYIETPELTYASEVVHGVWVYIDADNWKTGQICFVLDSNGSPSFSAELKPGTAQDWAKLVVRRSAECLGVGERELSKELEALTTLYESLLPLVLYLCSQDAEVGTGNELPSNPKPKLVKGGERLFPPNLVKVWGVGLRIGAAFRKANSTAAIGGESESHQSPRGHIRRAHWHGFRVGPKNREDGTEIPVSDRKLEIRWQPPLTINLDDVKHLPATIRKVLGPPAPNSFA